MPKKINKEEFIKKSISIHGNKYDYSKVEYINDKTKVCIICPEHGEFWQEPHSHLKGYGCKKCKRGGKYDTKIFINKAKQVHGDKYNYSKSKYIGSLDKICIICPEHGEFWQEASSHLRGKGCPYCNKTHKLSTEKFINKAKQIHGERYDYSKVEYTNKKTKVCIICPEHGEFWQEPRHHLEGAKCPQCNESKLEESIRILLSDNNIKFVKNCSKTTLCWIGRQHLDFYLPDYGIAIECQGKQHFFENEYFGGLNGFKNILLRDKTKKMLCDKNGVNLLYYSDLGIIYPYNVIEDKKILINLINGRKN